jgi:hypothetical protein
MPESKSIEVRRNPGMQTGAESRSDNQAQMADPPAPFNDGNRRRESLRLMQEGKSTEAKNNSEMQTGQDMRFDNRGRMQ